MLEKPLNLNQVRVIPLPVWSTEVWIPTLVPTKHEEACTGFGLGFCLFVFIVSMLPNKKMFFVCFQSHFQK